MTLPRHRFLAATAALAAAPAAARAQGLKTVTVGYVPSTLFAPVFVAETRGYLREAGIDAKLTPIVAGQDAMVLLAGDRLDVAAAGLSAAFFNAIARELEVRYVASTSYQPAHGHPSALMIREDLYDAGMHDPGALRGKKIGWLGSLGATGGYYVARILRPYHITMSEITPVNLPGPDQQAAFEHKAVDAILASAPFTTLFEQEHLARIIGSIPAGISCTGLFFGPTLLHDAPTASAFLRACRRGAAALAGNGYFAPDNLAAMAQFAHQPVQLIRETPRYNFKPDLRIDLPTLLDMQNEFITEHLLAYREPLDAAHLIARFPS